VKILGAINNVAKFGGDDQEARSTIYLAKELGYFMNVGKLSVELSLCGIAPVVV
jgi:hypothetical protein